jgi:hypothetical protein
LQLARVVALLEAHVYDGAVQPLTCQQYTSRAAPLLSRVRSPALPSALALLPDWARAPAHAHAAHAKGAAAAAGRQAGECGGGDEGRSVEEAAAERALPPVEGVALLEDLIPVSEVCTDKVLMARCAQPRLSTAVHGLSAVTYPVAVCRCACACAQAEVAALERAAWGDEAAAGREEEAGAGAAEVSGAVGSEVGGGVTIPQPALLSRLEVGPRREPADVRPRPLTP